MSDEAMTNYQLAMWLRIGVAMGLPVDELGHPYRQGQAYDLDGEQYHHLHDFNPLEDPADAFRVQVHFNLAIESEQDVFVIREGYGQILLIRSTAGLAPEARISAACEAIFTAASKLLARQDELQATGNWEEGRISSPLRNEKAP